MHHQRGHADARAHGVGLELRHQHAFACLDALLHRRRAWLPTGRTHARTGACTRAARRRRQQHQALDGQAAAGRDRPWRWPPANGPTSRAQRVCPACAGAPTTYSMARANCGRLLTAAGAAAVRRHLEQHGPQALLGQRLGQGQHLARMAAPAVHQQGHGGMRRGGWRVDGDGSASSNGQSSMRQLASQWARAVAANVAAWACRTGGRRRGPPWKARAAGRRPVQRGTAGCRGWPGRRPRWPRVRCGSWRVLQKKIMSSLLRGRAPQRFERGAGHAPAAVSGGEDQEGEHGGFPFFAQSCEIWARTRRQGMSLSDLTVGRSRASGARCACARSAARGVAQEARVVDQAQDQRIQISLTSCSGSVSGLRWPRFHGLQHRAAQRRAPAA